VADRIVGGSNCKDLVHIFSKSNSRDVHPNYIKRGGEKVLGVDVLSD